MVDGKVEIRKMTHVTPNIEGCTWEERAKRVEEYLTIYQNARYVVTRRLHVALPCLAMGVPVVVIEPYNMNDPNRFEPYKKWLHYVKVDDFLKHGFDEFDFINGTPNKKDYLKTRNELTKTMKDFIKYCEDNKNKPLSFFDKTSYSDLELYKWKSEFMKDALFRAHAETKQLFMKYVRGATPQKEKHKLLKTIYQKTIKKTKLKDSKIVKKLKTKLTKKKK